MSQINPIKHRINGKIELPVDAAMYPDRLTCPHNRYLCNLKINGRRIASKGGIKLVVFSGQVIFTSNRRRLRIPTELAARKRAAGIPR
jgi:hypothetical protein